MLSHNFKAGDLVKWSLVLDTDDKAHAQNIGVIVDIMQRNDSSYPLLQVLWISGPLMQKHAKLCSYDIDFIEHYA